MKRWLGVIAGVFMLLLPVLTLAEIVKLPIDFSPGLPYQGKFELDKMVYDDPSIHVERYVVANEDTPLECRYHYAYIKIANPTQLRTASVKGFENGHRALAAVMARRMNAVLAINGDFYGARPSCYVLRQGKVYRDTLGENQDVLLIDEDGDFHVMLAKDNPKNQNKEEINGKKVINAFTFGPAMIVNDEIVLDESSSPSMSQPESRAQRMVIAQTGPLEYMVVSCRAVGCTVQEMTGLVQSLADHIDVAYFLDGGQSSQMVFMGNLVNKYERDAREVTDIVYFASAWKEE